MGPFRRWFTSEVPTDPPPHWHGWYRLTLTVAVALTFVAQKAVEVRPTFRAGGLIEVRNDGGVKAALGVSVSVVLFALLVEFATLAVARRLARRRVSPPPAGERSPHRLRVAVLVLAGLFLALNLHGRVLLGYVPVVPTAVPPLATAGWLVAWAAFVAFVAWRRPPGWVDAVGFAALVVVTRLVAYAELPFDHIGGDMLSTIQRTQRLMLDGHFPYLDQPPPAMPYWPGTFLLYTPPEVAGWDYRWMNLLAELATVGVVGLVGVRGRTDAAGAFARTAVPLLLLLPNWTFYSAETQYPVSVLMGVLFVRAVASLGGGWQAGLLGLAVAANQTFGVLGLFVLPFWVRRYGVRTSAGLTALSVAAAMLLVGPFLLWNGREFLRVTTFSLDPLPPDVLAGRFTLRPLLDALFPHASTLFLGLVVVGGVAANTPRRATGPWVAAAAALGYCLALLALHRTFTHYFLSAVAMVIAIPYRPESAALPPAHTRA